MKRSDYFHCWANGLTAGAIIGAMLSLSMNVVLAWVVMSTVLYVGSTILKEMGK